MKRLYYLTASKSEVQGISRDLHQQGVTDWRFHVFCKDEAGHYAHRLRSANVLERSELFRCMERGVITGALVGGCIVAALALLTSLTLPPAAWASMFIFSIVAGAWLGGVGGISSENWRVKRFDGAIRDGQYLVMIDVPGQRVEQMKTVMKKHHPKAELQMVGSSTSEATTHDGEFPA